MSMRRQCWKKLPVFFVLLFVLLMVRLTVHGEEETGNPDGIVEIPEEYVERFEKDRILIGDYIPQTVRDESAALYAPEARSRAAARTAGNLVTGRVVYYDAYSTNEFYVDGNLAYCAQPQKGTPPNGSYNKIYDYKWYLPTQTDDQAELVRRCLYYCYGSPGFDAGMFPATWFDGSAMNADRYIALSHILISDVYAFDGVASMYGCSRDFMNWVAYHVTGYDVSDGHEINAGSTRHQALGKGAPDNFRAFILDTGSVSQNILGFEYDPKGGIELWKRSADTAVTEGNGSYSLAGAVYGVYQNGVEAGTITTDENGYGRLDDLPEGNYTIQEKAAPKGFVIDTAAYDVTVTGGQTTVFETAEQPQKGILALQKSDRETGENTAQGAADLEGAVYDIFRKDAYSQGDDTEAPSYVQTLITDGEGRAASGELPLGTYLVIEREASGGYLVDTEIHEVTLASFNGTDYVFTENVHSKEEIIRGDVEIIKLKENTDPDSDTLEGLAGVEFTFTSHTTGEVVRTIETDKNGYATTADAEHPRGGLIFDTYTVTETRWPEGLKPIEPFDVTISKEGVTLKGIYKEDKLIASPVIVVKVDKSTGRQIPVAGAEFRLLDEDKNPVALTTYYPGKEDLEIFKTDEKGQFSFPEKLGYGKYYLEEVTAPHGYLKGELLEFEVTEGASWDHPLTVTYADENAMGQIVIWKTDDKGEKLSGAVFEIRAAEDIVTPDGTVRMKKGDLASTLTAEEGKAVSEPLYLGKYIVTEIEAPKGYVPEKKETEVELRYQDQETPLVTEEITVINEPEKPGQNIFPKTGDDADLAVRILLTLFCMVFCCGSLYSIKKKYRK